MQVPVSELAEGETTLTQVIAALLFLIGLLLIWAIRDDDGGR